MGTLASPGRVWWKPLGRDEKIWVSVALIWCLFIFAMMWIWPTIGEQNTPIESYRIAPADFAKLADEFVHEYQIGDLNGVPIVEPPAGGDVYMVAKMFQFSPILQLKKGETYRFLLSSLDMQHGFSLQPMNLNFQALPGYLYVINLTPTETGEFSIVCNEYCGLGHHLMSGRIIVTE